MADASIHKVSMLVHLTERGEWREVCDAVETVGKGQKEVGHLKHQDEDNDVAFSVLSKQILQSYQKLMNRSIFNAVSNPLRIPEAGEDAPP